MNDQYLQDLYEYIVSTDNTYQDDVSFDDFKAKMSDRGYAEKMYGYISELDPTYSQDVSLEDFFSKVNDQKKKEPTTGLPLEDGSLVQQESEEAVEVQPEETQETDIYKGTILDQEKDTFERRLSVVTPQLTDAEEEFVVPELDYLFKDYGFTFEETGIGDNVLVKASNEQQITVPLDAFTAKGDKENADMLRSFLTENKIDIDPLKNIGAKERKILNEQEILKTVKVFNDETEAFKKEANSFSKEYIQFNKEFEQLKSLGSDAINDNPILRQKYDEAVEKQKQFVLKYNQIVENQEYFKSKGADLDRIAGEYYEKSSEQGEFLSAVWNKVMQGFSNYGKTAERAVFGAFADIMTTDEMKASQIRNYAEKNNIEIPEGLDDQGVIEFIKEYDKVENEAPNPITGTGAKSISYPTYEKIVEKPKDIFKKEMLYAGDMYRNPFSSVAASTDTEMGMIDAIDKGTREFFMTDNTTEQYEKLKQEGFWGGAVLGLAESLPAMMGAGAAGWAQRTAQMYSLTTEHVYDEMEKDPAFDDVTEREKFYVTAPIGIAVGALESIGFRNIVSQKGLLNGLVARAIGASTEKTTAKTFGEFIKNDVKNLMSRGVLTMTGAGLAEFETGFAQEIAEVGIKDIYNMSKGKDMFQTPDTFTEYFTQALRAGAQEMVGGFIMGTIPAAASMAKKGNLNELSDEQWGIFKEIIKDPTYKNLYKADIQRKIAAGEITSEQAQQSMSQLDALVSIADEVGADLSEGSQKEVIQLLLEKKKLLNEIEGKDGSLVKKKKARIDEISSSIESIIENDAETKTTEESEVKEEEIVSSKTLDETDQELADIQEMFSEEVPSQTTEETSNQKEEATTEEEVELPDGNRTDFKVGDQFFWGFVGDVVTVTAVDNDSVTFTDPRNGKNRKAGKIGLLNTINNPLDTTYSELNQQNTEQTAVEEEIVTDEEQAPTTEKSTIDELFEIKEDGTLPDGVVPVGTSVTSPMSVRLNQRGGRSEKSRGFSIKTVENAAKAVSKILPDLRIVLHANNEEYVKYTGREGRGEFVPKDNVIHINMSEATKTTVAHEIFHAVFLNKVKTDARAAKAAEKMIMSVRKTLANDSDLAKKIDEFASKYDENIQNEERLAELVGILSSEYRTLKRSAKDRVIDFLKSIARRFGIKLESDFGKDDQSVIDLLNAIARKTAEGKEITDQDIDLLNTEPYSVGVPVQLNPEGVSPPQKRQSKLWQDVDFVTEIPTTTLQDFSNRVNGQLFAVTSDLTKVGYDKSGKRIDGGVGYMAIKENVDTNTGFASVDKATARGTIGAIMNQYPAGSNVGVMIMVQSPSATIGNSYGIEYFGKAIQQIQKSDPKAYEQIYQSLEDMITNKDGKSKAIAREIKKNNTEESLLNLLKNPNAFTLKGFVEEFLKDTSFEVRRPMMQKIIIKSKETRTNKSTPIYKTALRDAGFTIQDFLSEYGDKELIGEKNMMEDNGGFLVGGFEMTVPTKEEVDSFTQEAQEKGLTHPLFNGKLPSNGNVFMFDGLYHIQENLQGYVVQETEFKKDSTLERDARVRDYAEKKGESVYEDSITNEASKSYVEPEKRTYTHLKPLHKTNFKSLNKDLLTDRTPSLKANVSRGLPVIFDKQKTIPKEGAFTAPQPRQQVNEEIEFGKMINPTRVSVSGIDISNIIFVTGYGKGRIIDDNIKQLKSDIKFANDLSRGKSTINTTFLRDRLLGFVSASIKGQQSIIDLKKKNVLKRDGSLNNRILNGIALSEERIDLLKEVGDTISENLFSVSDLEITDGVSPRQQKPMNEIIQEARDNNFSDSTIRDFLVRKLKMKASVVDAALEIPASMFEMLPKSFGDMKGGVNVGMALYQKIRDHRKKLERRNARSTWKTDTEIKAMVVDFAKQQKKTYDTNAQLSEKVRLFEEKLNKNNKKRKEKLSSNEIRRKVSEYRKKITDERNAKREKVAETIQKFEANEVRKNNRRVKPLSEQEIMTSMIEFMQQQDEFIQEGDTFTEEGVTKFREGLSTQQAKMISELQKGVGIRPTQDMSAKIRKARVAIRERMKGQRDLQAIKRAMRNFIRQSLPSDVYSKSDVINMIRKITDVDKDNIENLMAEVEEFVVSKNVNFLNKKINDILDGKYTETVNGRKKGVKIDLVTKENIDKIKSYIVSAKATVEEILAANEKLQIKWNELDSKPGLTIEEQMEMVNLQVAIEMNNSMLMESTDANKVSALDLVYTTLSEMIDFGRTSLQNELAEEKAEYDRQFEVAYEEITGYEVNMSDEGAKAQLESEKNEMVNEDSKKSTSSRIKNVAMSFIRGVEAVFTSSEALDGLMDKISSSVGEMFGGRLQDEITAKVDEASRRYKERKMFVEYQVKNKLEELYGKNWQKETRNNRKKTVEIQLNRDAIEQAQEDYNNNPNQDTKNALDKALNNSRMYSQNQLYYLYNQFKDPANMGAFINMFASEISDADLAKQRVEDVMSQIEENLDDKVKEFADWQVNEFFPSLYDNYNDVYKKMYRTNMPWNVHYAGRIYRDGVTPEPLDLLSDNNSFGNSVNGSSTKARTSNNVKIKEMDGTDALMSYLNDMEYFAAYATTVRDINKIFTNEYIKNAITKIHGKQTMALIENMIQKIANKGTRTEQMTSLINSMNNVFILSRLSLSPVIMIKQLTSTFTYANDIGVRNWIKYSAKSLPELISIWSEIRNNSVYMQDRKYDSIMKAIESYSESSMQEFVPSPTKDFIVNFMMSMVKFGDRSAIYLGGTPNYMYYKDQALNSGKSEQEAIDIAVRKFERDTKRTQQSSDLQDKDVFQTSNPVVRALNMFLSTPKQYLRKEIQAVRSLNRKLLEWDKNAGKGTIKENVRTLLMYHVFMPVLFQYVAAGLPGLLRGWREDDDDDLIRAGVIGNLNSLFILGEVISGFGDYFTGKPWAGESSKTVGIISSMYGIIRKMKKAENVKDEEKKAKYMKDAVLEMVTLTGIPAPTLSKMYDNYGKVMDSEDFGEAVLRMMNFSEYQISGKKKSEEKYKTIDEINKEYERELNKENREKKKNEGRMDNMIRRGNQRESRRGNQRESRRGR